MVSLINQYMFCIFACQEIFCTANYWGLPGRMLPAAINQVDKSGQNEQ
jgi:hypothetical protein